MDIHMDRIKEGAAPLCGYGFGFGSTGSVCKEVLLVLFVFLRGCKLNFFGQKFEIGFQSFPQ